MRDCPVIYEEGPNSWSAYVPDLPGCFAVGATREEVASLIPGAIAMHIKGLKEDGEPIPAPTTHAARVPVQV